MSILRGFSSWACGTYHCCDRASPRYFMSNLEINTLFRNIWSIDYRIIMFARSLWRLRPFQKCSLLAAVAKVRGFANWSGASPSLQHQNWQTSLRCRIRNAPGQRGWLNFVWLISLRSNVSLSRDFNESIWISTSRVSEFESIWVLSIAFLISTDAHIPSLHQRYTLTWRDSLNRVELWDVN